MLNYRKCCVTGGNPGKSHLFTSKKHNPFYIHSRRIYFRLNLMCLNNVYFVPFFSSFIFLLFLTRILNAFCTHQDRYNVYIYFVFFRFWLKLEYVWECLLDKRETFKRNSEKEKIGKERLSSVLININLN